MLVPKLRFKEFNNSYKIVKLGDYVTINSGSSPSEFEFLQNGIPYYKVEQLNNSHKYQILTPYYINTEQKRIKKGSIIFPKRGAAILLNKIRILNQDSYMDTNLMTLTTNSELDNEYLYYFLNKVNLSTIADTSSIPQINNKHIEPYNIAVPSLNEQQKNSIFLSYLDQKIELQINKVEALKLYKKGLANNIFNDAAGEPKKLGQVLCKWNLKNKENKIDYVESVSNKYGFIPQSQQFEDRSVASFDKSNYYIIKKNVFAYNPSRLDVGSLALKTDDKVSLVSPLYECFTTNENTQYLLEWFESNKFKYAIKSRFEGGVRNTLTFKNLSEVEIIMPSIEIQNKFAVLFVTFNKKIDNEEKKLEKLRQLKKGLLQQMFV